MKAADQKLSGFTGIRGMLALHGNSAPRRSVVRLCQRPAQVMPRRSTFSVITKVYGDDDIRSSGRSRRTPHRVTYDQIPPIMRSAIYFRGRPELLPHWGIDFWIARASLKTSWPDAWWVGKHADATLSKNLFLL